MIRRAGAARLLCYALFASLTVCAAALLTSLPARAEITNIDGVDAPIVRVQIPAQANLTIRTWDHPTVQLDGDTSSLLVDRLTNRIPAILPPTLIRVGQTKGPDGIVVLPAESFVVSSVPAGPRTVVLIRGQAGHPVGPLVVTIPANTVLLVGNVARGSLTLERYQNGTFILHLNNGVATLDNVSGDGFVQVLRGPLFAVDSNFNRLRVRTAVGRQIFEHCNSKQIEATIVNGPIVYDNGHFEAGLARFDSAFGDVAIGTTSAAQLNAHAAGGKIYTLFERRTQIDNRETEASALVEGGGPLVTASTANGSVFLYDGSLRTKPRIPAEWKATRAALLREPPRGVAPVTKPPESHPPAMHPPPPPHNPAPRGGPKSGRRMRVLR